MAFLDQPRVQAYLESTKATIDSIDVDLDRASADYVISSMNQYDVSGWLDKSNTPTLVLELIAMRYAGIYYSRQYSEDIDQMNAWASWLLRQVDQQIQAINTGVIDIPGADPISNTRGPLFFPRDQQDFDGLGSETKFTMGRVF
jgi:hypothetical protein